MENIKKQTTTLPVIATS